MLKKIKKLIKENRMILIILFLYFSYISLAIATNGSLIFEYKVLEKYGDQHLYISLAENILSGNYVPHIYSVGFSLFLIPFIVVLDNSSWEVVTKYVVLTQILIIIPLTIFLLINLVKKLTERISKKSKIILTAVTTIFISYEALVLYKSFDPIPFDLLFGLIPYSEPLTILLIIIIYYLTIKERFFLKTFNLPIYFFLGVFVSYALTVRIMVLFLLLPILLHFLFLLLEKDYKKVGLIVAGMITAYSPQLYYSYIAYADPFMVGYNLNWERVQPRYAEAIKTLYGIESKALFNIEYLKNNLISLFYHYIHFVIISIISTVLIIKNKLHFSKKGLFILSLNFSVIIYVIIYLSYFWSKLSDCIDRFLLPLAFIIPLSIYLVYYISNENSKENKEK